MGSKGSFRVRFIPLVRLAMRKAAGDRQTGSQAAVAPKAALTSATGLQGSARVYILRGQKS